MRKYDNYKDSGIEWIGQIPEHWEVVPIKYSLLMPLTDGPHETPELTPDGIPFISAEAIKNDKIDFNKKRGFISIEEHERFSLKYKPQMGDVYMIKSGATTGNLARVQTNEEFNIWSPLAAFRPAPNKTTTDFLFFFMRSSRFFSAIELGWNYGTQQNIGMNVLENLRMVRPTIQEQTAIANYLDRKTAEIDELIADKKRLLELYEEEKTAIINQAVTKGINPNVPMKDSGIEWLGEIPEHWEVKNLRYLCKITTGGKDTENREDDGEFPFFVRSQTVEKISTYSYDGEAILTAGDGVGVCKVWHHIIGKFDFHQRVYMMYDFDGILGSYLFHYMKENFIHDVLKKSAKSTVDSLRRPMFLEFAVAFPKSEDEQKEIVQYIENEIARIDSKSETTKKLIDLLTEYRTALISEVVTGKIKVI